MKNLILPLIMSTALVFAPFSLAHAHQEKGQKINIKPSSKVLMSGETKAENKDKKDKKPEKTKAQKDKDAAFLRDVLFRGIYDLVKEHYVEEPDEEKMMEGAINGMLSVLDPHSNYFDSESFKELKEKTDGKIIGIGIELIPENGVIKVITPVEDGPADLAGIKPGDYIIKIDDELVMGMSIDEAVKRLRGGPEGSEVKVVVNRDGKNIDVTLKRSVIKYTSVKWFTVDDVGYLRITTFNENTEESLKDAMKKIQSKLKDKLKGYVIDVRNNAGGLLDQSVTVCNQFFKEPSVVVEMRGRDPQKVEKRFSSPTGLSKDLPVVVLINGGSASASEIVAGAFKDTKRAIVMGTPSFGKGSVQVVIPLGEDRGMKMTTARFYTPAGNPIQGHGIIPDVEVKQLDFTVIEENMLYREKNIPGSLKAEPSEKDSKESMGLDLKVDKADNAKDQNKDQHSRKIDEIKDYQLRMAVQMVHVQSLLTQKISEKNLEKSK